MVAIKLDSVVYVTIYRNNGRMPPYHFDAECKLRLTSLRLPTLESEARKIGLHKCTHCRDRPAE